MDSILVILSLSVGVIIVRIYSSIFLLCVCFLGPNIPFPFFWVLSFVMFNRSFRPNGSKVDYLQPKKLQMQQEVEKKQSRKQMLYEFSTMN